MQNPEAIKVKLVNSLAYIKYKMYKSIKYVWINIYIFGIINKFIYKN